MNQTWNDLLKKPYIELAEVVGMLAYEEYTKTDEISKAKYEAYRLVLDEIKKIGSK